MNANIYEDIRQIILFSNKKKQIIRPDSWMNLTQLNQKTVKRKIGTINVAK